MTEISVTRPIIINNIQITTVRSIKTSPFLFSNNPVNKSLHFHNYIGIHIPDGFHSTIPKVCYSEHMLF